MMVFVAFDPDRVARYIGETMQAAQAYIAEQQPDIVQQSRWAIHPLVPKTAKSMEALRLTDISHYKLEKFDGDYCGQEPVEIIEGAIEWP